MRYSKQRELILNTVLQNKIHPTADDVYKLSLIHILAKFFKDYNKQIHFVNAAAVLKDSKGCLDSRYSSGDGIHLTGEAYDMILDEMQNQLF